MRVKLTLPKESPVYSTEFTLGVADMNYGNHLGNDRVLTLAHETRLRFICKFEETELSFCGSALIMADAALQYKGQGYMGDKLVAHLWPANATKYGFDFYVHLEKEDGQEVARVKTGMLFFDYDKNKIAQTPPLFFERFPQIKGE